MIVVWRQVDMKQELLFAVCTRTFVAWCISCDGSRPEVGKETAWKGKVAKFTSGVVFGFVEFCTKYWISIKPSSSAISASLKIKDLFVLFWYQVSFYEHLQTALLQCSGSSGLPESHSNWPLRAYWIETSRLMWRVCPSLLHSFHLSSNCFLIAMQESSDWISLVLAAVERGPPVIWWYPTPHSLK